MSSRCSNEQDKQTRWCLRTIIIVAAFAVSIQAISVVALALPRNGSVHTLTGHTAWVRSVVYSPDGHHLASGSDDKTIKLWDVGTGTCLKTLTGHSALVFCVA